MEPLRVLIVDDEAGMRTGVKRALEGTVLELGDIDMRVPLTVETAADGEEAMARLKTARPDLLLLDHRLPGISGLEILETVAGEPDMLTIMVTAYASLEMAVNATKRGAFDFLAKPFTPQELKAAVRKAAHHLLGQREARRLAEEKRRMRFEFLSVLAHELKAPLAAIDGYLHLIQQRVAGDELVSYDRMVDRSIVRLDGMRKLIYDLLDLTRIESGRKKREIGPVDLAEVAELSVENVATAAADRNITVASQVAETLPMTADRGEMEIILNNLLSNAVKYNRDDGRVDLTIEATDEQVVITVADTGIGIAEADLARLFEEFSRIKNEATRDILGSGLGLSILKKLARLNGGDVAVASEVGQGTTFTVTLRRHQEQGEPTQ